MANSTAWKAVAEERPQIDEGDILTPLRRVRNKYLAHADELRSKAFGENRSSIVMAAQRAENAADAVSALFLRNDASAVTVETTLNGQTNDWKLVKRSARNDRYTLALGE